MVNSALYVLNITIFIVHVNVCVEMLKLLTNKFNPLMPTVAIWRAERQSAQMSKITNDGLT